MADDYITDPEVLARLNRNPAEQAQYITDKDLLERLNRGGTTASEPPAAAPVGLESFETDPAAIAAKGGTSAAITAYGYQPGKRVVTPGMAYESVGRPVMEATTNVFNRYITDPLKSVVKPSGPSVPMPTADIARQAIPEIRKEISGIASQSDLIKSPVSGRYYPESVPDYRQIQKAAGGDIAEKMSQAWEGKLFPDATKNDAVMRLLETDPTVRAKMADPNFARLVENFTGKVPSGMERLGRGLGMLGRTAARVAGPVGLASTAYDIYQAAPYAARMLQTGVAGRQGQLGQTADEMPMVTGPVEPNYIDEIKRRAAEKALGR